MKLETKATRFWTKMPRDEWLKFKDIPEDIFTDIFNRLDSNPNMDLIYFNDDCTEYMRTKTDKGEDISLTFIYEKEDGELIETILIN